MQKKLFCIENRLARGRRIKHEDGQGLVEYALILVLVAIVVIAILLILGPLVPPPPPDCLPILDPDITDMIPYHVEPHCTKNPITPLKLDYFAHGRNHLFDPTSLKVISPLQCRSDVTICGGLQVNTNESGVIDGTITFFPGPELEGDDTLSFDFELCLLPPNDSICGSNDQPIKIGKYSVSTESSGAAFEKVETNVDTATVDGTTIDTTTVSSAVESEEVGPDWVDIYDQSRDFLRQAYQIEYSVVEAVVVSRDAFDGATAIIVEYATDTNNSVLQVGIEAVVQAVDDRNAEAVISALAGIATELAQVPGDVRIAVIEEITPRIIEAYHTLYGTVVADNAIDKPLQLLVDEEDKNPGSTYDSIPLLLERWDRIQQLNQGIEVIQPVLKEDIFYVIGILADSGNEDYIELARQYEDDFFWGLLYEAIDKALVEPEGIRTSLESKANTARSAYISGDLEGAGTALSDILNEVRAQNGKNITLDSATLIRDSVIELAESLEIPLTAGD